MPCVDMSVEKLMQYQGKNPRPADFDEFWDASLAELDTIDPKVEFKPYALKSKFADCYELTFTSAKGARIYAKLVKPKNLEGKVPAILQFHGLSGDSDDWSKLLRDASQGFVVAAMDSRGQGGYSEDVGGTLGSTYSTPFSRGLDGDPKDLYCRNLFLDTAMLARIVMGLDYVDETRVATTGSSQGGGLALACAALVPEIRLCAASYPYMSDYKRVFEMDLNKGAYEGIRYYFRNFDPTHAREEEIFTKLGYIDIQFLAPRIRAKVLMATGLMDTTCPPSTQFATYNKITSKKEVVIYPDYGHENIKGRYDLFFNFLAELAD